MTAIPSGFNYSTVSQGGVAFDICWSIDTINAPEYPLPPFAFGTQVTGLDNSVWCFVKPAGAYAIGTVGYIDGSWNFVALTNANGANAIGNPVGVLSQVASVTTPTAYRYDGVWAQISGQSPAINVAASTPAYTQLYTSVTAGQLTSVSGGQPLYSIVITTASVTAGNQPGILT